MDTRKYIFENGVMKLNPAYKTNAPATTVAEPNKALTIVSSTQDIADATNAQQQAIGKPMQLAPATTASMEIMQDQDYLNKFQAPQKVDGGQLLDGLSNIFAKYEVPVGLINKLLALSEYKLNFLVDDSGSMSCDSDALISQATQYIKQKHAQNNQSPVLSRWEEAEDRIHIMLDMLAYIPTYTITISFLNRKDKVILEHTGKSPDQFAAEAHQKVSAAFRSNVCGGTPAYSKLKESFDLAVGPTMHYMFTDGVPSDASIDKMKDLVLHRRAPQTNPLTFMSCTDQDSEAEWMKEIEEVADYTAELDDFEDEKREVLKDQGPGFPFSRGFWLICQLVAAINPVDLDKLDESMPFTKQTMDNLLGRKITLEEYKQYFDNNPNAKKYYSLYNQFAREDLIASQIVDKNGNPLPNQSQPAYSQQNYNQQAPVYNQQQPAYNQNPPPFNPQYTQQYNPGLFGGASQQPSQQQGYPANPSYAPPRYR